ncbi:hypothetical protein [Microbacterium luteum]|uniref:hypothetical protein n=1 Tax=Microbacterium luteum TaxID=2782167 RepID=UPI001889AE4F|nr:hypothetical protein [Microbacterium luteum]
MSIQAEITVTVAEVEVTDDYRVGLSTIELATTYTPDEALQLAEELVAAAEEARTAAGMDLAEVAVPSEVVHAAPPFGGQVTACCGKPMRSLDMPDRVSYESGEVTCWGNASHGFDVDGQVAP